jgi:hypothetical protein
MGDIEVSETPIATSRSERHRHWEQAIQCYRLSLEAGKQIPPLAPDDLGKFDAGVVARRLHKAEFELRKLA